MDRLRGVSLTDLDAVRSITTGQRPRVYCIALHLAPPQGLLVLCSWRASAVSRSGHWRGSAAVSRSGQQFRIWVASMVSTLTVPLLPACTVLQWSRSWC